MDKRTPFNVLMILADQMNANWLGCAGHPQAQTPNLDAFAASGIRFTEAHCQNPICTPSRVSILSGQYCQNHGYYGLSGPAPKGLNNLFRHFGRQGYRTAAYGKLHLPEAPRNWIADDVDVFGDSYENADGVFGASSFLEDLERKGLRHLEDSWHNLQNYGKPSIPIDAMPSELPLEETQEMWCARETMDFILDYIDHPFCVQVAFQKPHHPLLPNIRFWNQYPSDLELPADWDVCQSHRAPHFQKRWREWRDYPPEFGHSDDTFEDFVRRCWRGTLACVSQIDYVFGQLMEFLRVNDLEKNTIVIFGSDHGAYHGHMGILEKAPGICSDQVCKVPSLWRVPGLTRGGSCCSQLVENIDMTSTLSSLCNLREFDSGDGKDLTGLLGGEDYPVRDVSVTENVWSKALRWKHWRFVHYQEECFPGEDVGELYNLLNDPQETRNLYKDPSYRNVVEDCRRQLLEWLIRTRRTVTTQCSLSDEVHLATPGHRSCIYPLGGDGTAPNAAQAYNRSDIHEMYR
ncbi:sulfatase family protein [Puniceicoccus vermicola]|uniref:Sulfatase-like hydrolase/transferase n=1 Tax=Puniceicoccus vermicola TaxID=388746 RepID=A0A7X1B0M8_9BACT|nr:sulfatase-like hydrolase/transferase [Puniceicoccus vermicola]MBC2603445.1 sulfatase-like hydrolase/transferase [Puniceicoccus vermicola]